MTRFEPRRSDEYRRTGREDAFLFGFGLSALLVVTGIIAASFWPALSMGLAEAPSIAPPAVLMPQTPTAPRPAATLLPTLTPTPTPPPPTPTATPLPDHAQLVGIVHEWQTWNNCGPATLTMALSYFGRHETQADAAPHLKPNRDDKNVGPDELAAYARPLGFSASVRQGGSLDLLKRFLNNNLPVIVETWQLYNGDGLGHYRLITGYDDTAGQLTTFDSLKGPDYKVAYDQFEADWRVFNHLYLIVYPPEQADTVRAIIGADMDDAAMYERVLAQAQTEIESRPNDAIAWFNQGEALTRLGRYPAAVTAFDRARQIGLHWRRWWYQFTPFEAYYAIGRYQDLLDLTATALKSSGGLEEASYYHGLARLALNQPGAADDFRAALKANSLFTPAQEALARLAAGQ